MIEIAPSILSANVLCMGQDIQMVLDAGTNILHVDVMDGHFVPNITYGPHVVRALRKAFPNAILDVHLMMSNPTAMFPPFAEAGADELTIHIEVEEDVRSILQQIRARGIKPGLSLRPVTDVKRLLPYLAEIDQVLVMSVEPGFGGQKLIPETLDKVRFLRNQGFAGILSVDGGIHMGTAQDVVSAGATRLVMGSGVYGSEDPAAVIKHCQQLQP